MPAPGSRGGQQALPRARAARCVCLGRLLLLPGLLSNKTSLSSKKTPKTKTVQGKKPHQPNQSDRYCTQIPFIKHEAV